MAIFKQIEVKVLVDGDPVHEYSDPAEDIDHVIGREEDAVIEKHIESVAGSTFEIQVRLNPGFSFEQHGDCDTLSYETYVDGKWIQAPLLIEDHYIPGEPLVSDIQGLNHFVDGQWMIYKLRFGTLMPGQTKHVSPQDTTRLSQLGSIRVIVAREKRIKVEELETSSPPPDLQNDKWSEKDLKGQYCDTLTEFESPVSNEEGVFWDTRRTHDKPLVTFIFKYCSRAALQKAGIIERPRSPTPLEDKDEDTLTPEQLRELVKRRKKVISSGEDNSRFLKKKLKRAENEMNLYTISTLKRTRDASPPPGDDDLQEIKRPRKDRNITIIELD